MHLRPYRIDDKAACLRMFDGNAPDFFALHERDGFEEFLETPGTRYWVVDDDAGTVIGCSGYRIVPETTTAIITWTMVERDVQGQGVGRLLILTDLDHLCRIPAVDTVILETSQHIVGFYERVAGFEAHEVIEDGLKQGLVKTYSGPVSGTIAASGYRSAILAILVADVQQHASVGQLYRQSLAGIYERLRMVADDLTAVPGPAPVVTVDCRDSRRSMALPLVLMMIG